MSLLLGVFFRPYKKVKIGPIYFQGLIAKRKEDIAKNVADTVTRDLVDREDLIGQLIKEEDEEYFTEYISNRVSSTVI